MAESDQSIALMTASALLAFTGSAIEMAEAAQHLAEAAETTSEAEFLLLTNSAAGALKSVALEAAGAAGNVQRTMINLAERIHRREQAILARMNRSAASDNN